MSTITTTQPATDPTPATASPTEHARGSSRAAGDSRFQAEPPPARPQPIKVIIQIPCYNEERTLPETIAALPKTLPGVERVEYLLINDGSTDGTVATALRLGVHHVLDIRTNRGLADAFGRGLQLALALGADVIVNTDGDNQYEGADIEKLVRTLLAEKSDIVIGDREVANVKHFSPIKRRLQALGSRVVSVLARQRIPDATSGFRAYSRDAALNMVITGTYTYTLESILLAARSGLAITSVPIRSRAVERTSRLFRNIPEYLWRAGLSIFRAFLFYNPALVFVWIGLIGFLSGGVGLLGGTFYPEIRMPAWFIGGIALVGGLAAMLLSVLADIINSQRRYNREILLHLRRHMPAEGSGLGAASYIRNPNPGA